LDFSAVSIRGHRTLRARRTRGIHARVYPDSIALSGFEVPEFDFLLRNRDDILSIAGLNAAGEQTQ